ncbi:MAG: diguanylate cyclase [Clostridia bacterium]|nr:diguanylate cyclase [Clostridia bacterium]
MLYGGKMECELEKAELEMILSDTVAGIAMVSPHSEGVKLEYTNEGFFALFGYTRDEYETLPQEVRLNLFHYDDFMNIISRVNTAYKPGEIQKFECRINKKNGEVAWALFSVRKPHSAQENEQRFICNIVDITEMKRLQMRIQEEKERYELIEEISDDIMFNYDVATDTLECSPKILRTLRTATKVEDAIEYITYGNVLDHRDIPLFIEAVSNALSGKRINIFDARIINQRSDAVWHRIKFASIFDADGNAVRFIGTISDIDKEKKEKSRLIAQAETDQLTGFLNKVSTGLKINELIKEYPNEPGTMFLIDIDDFKLLNDTYGHHEGDIFLREFTSKLTLAFRSTDILGRVGGEEFVVFVNGLGDVKELVEEKAKEIEKICHSVKLEKAKDRVMSCSIGVAIYPETGMDYNDLFEKSDEAMYYVKKHGKNGYAFAE